MTSESPLITVFMAVYNGEKYVGDAIASVLGQTFPDFELLIIDDGSTDTSMAVVSAFSDARIRVLRNGRNLGLFETRNRGVDEARGRYFATLDCDDVAYPDRLERQLAYMEEHPSCAVCGGGKPCL